MALLALLAEAGEVGGHQGAADHPRAAAEAVEEVDPQAKEVEGLWDRGSEVILRAAGSQRTRTSRRTSQDPEERVEAGARVQKQRR